MRVAMTARARYTEDRLSEAFTRGIRQCVILGAGLDFLAYRSRPRRSEARPPAVVAVVGRGVRPPA